MNANRIFESWAPRESVWSPWVKGVLFSFMEQLPGREFKVDEFDSENCALPPKREGWGLVIDLPGEDSVTYGLQMAAHGFRPVPVYTSVPWPEYFSSWIPVQVPMVAVIRALAAAESHLRQLNLAGDAPPAFLLDSRRRRMRVEPREDD